VVNVADRLVELSQSGLLPIGTQGAGSFLERDSFFSGKLLTANEFQDEQHYSRKESAVSFRKFDKLSG
jgi:hypothetical protein